MKKILTVAVGDPTTLAAFLTARGIEREAASGGVHVDGKRATDEELPLRPGMKIVVYADARPPMKPRVVFQDDWILVIDKPPGMASQASRADSAASLETWGEKHHGKLVHRLDRDASGLMALVKKGELAPDEMVRRYLARVPGPVEGEGDIRLRIARDPKDERKRRALPENDPNGHPAHTHWKALSPTLLELTLDTGRTHQIRVHLAAIGQPIDGDPLYGGAPARRLMLHAHELSLRHPQSRKQLTFSAPLTLD